MPNVAAGTTASYTFTSRQTIGFTTDPGEALTYQVLRAGATIASGRATSDSSIGPFLTGDVLSVTAQRGAVDYNINAAPSQVSGIGGVLTAAEMTNTPAEAAAIGGSAVVYLTEDGQEARSNATTTAAGWFMRRTSQPAQNNALALDQIRSVDVCWVYRASDTAFTEREAHWIYVPRNEGWYDASRISRYDIATQKAPNMGRRAIARMSQYVAHDAATKVGSWASTVPNYVHQSKLASTSTAGDTITWTGIVGSSFVLRCTFQAACGYAVVSIDGSYTTANRLPTFTAADLTASKCRAQDVGRAYINFTASTTVADVHVQIADGLADSAHTVVVECTGTKQPSAGGVQIRLAGMCAVSAAVAGDSPGATRAFAHVEDIYTSDLSGEQMLPVFAIETLTTGTYQFVGGVHSGGSDGIETLVSWSLKSASADLSALAAGTYQSAQALILDVQSTLATSDASVVAVASKDMRVVFSTRARAPVTASTRYGFQVERRILGAYPGMLSLRTRDMLTGSLGNRRWPRMQFGLYRVDSLGANNGFVGYVPAYDCVAQSLGGHVAYLVNLHPEPREYAFGGRGAFVNDTESFQYSKMYLSAADDYTPQTMRVGDTWISNVAWGTIPRRA